MPAVGPWLLRSTFCVMPQGWCCDQDILVARIMLRILVLLFTYSEASGSYAESQKIAAIRKVYQVRLSNT